MLSPAGSFASVFALFALAFWLVHWITKRTTEITASHGELNKSVMKIEGQVDEMRRDLSYLKENIDLFHRDRPSLAKQKSPVSLTEKGEAVSVDIGAEKIIAANWSRIFADLETSVSHKNAYDIQQYCLETAAVDPSRFFCEEDLLRIKNYAFKHGETLAYYSIVFAIIIRDGYLSKKGISVDEIDRNDPDRIPLG